MFSALVSSASDALKGQESSGSRVERQQQARRRILVLTAVGVGAFLLVTVLVLVGSYAFKGKPVPKQVPVVDPKPDPRPSLLPSTEPIFDILVKDPVLAFRTCLKRHFAVTVSVLAVSFLLVAALISLVVYVSVAPAPVEPEPEPEPFLEPEVIDKDEMGFFELFQEDPWAALKRPVFWIPSLICIIGLIILIFLGSGMAEPREKIIKDVNILYNQVYAYEAHINRVFSRKFLESTVPTNVKASSAADGTIHLKCNHGWSVRLYMFKFISSNVESKRAVLLPVKPLSASALSQVVGSDGIDFTVVDLSAIGNVDTATLSRIRSYLQVLQDIKPVPAQSPTD